MRKAIHTAILFATHFLLQAQAPAIEWKKCFGGNGGDYGKTIHQTPDGGYIMAGTIGNTFSDYSSGGDIAPHDTIDCEWIVKTDPSGSIEWQKFGAQKIDQTSDGGYIGISKINGLIKMDSAGNKIWQYATSISGELNVRQTSDNGFIFNNTRSGLSDDFRITKVDKDGNFLWHSDTVGGSRNDDPYTVIETTDGGFLQVGLSFSINGDVTDHHGDHTTSDCWVVRYNSQGHVVWAKSYGSSGSEVANDVVRTSDGHYVIAATMNATTAPDGDVTEHFGGSDIWLLKIDDSGNILWEKTIGTTWGNESPNRIQQTTDGGFIVTGVGPAGFGHGASVDMYVVKTDENGVKQWDKSLGSVDNEEGADIKQTADGGYIIIGMTQQHNGDNGDVAGNHGMQDFWVVKLGEETTGIYSPENQFALDIYPNPAKETVTVSNLPIGALLTVSDLTGKTIYSTVSKDKSLMLNTADYESGMYLIQVEQNGAVANSKLIITQ